MDGVSSSGLAIVWAVIAGAAAVIAVWRSLLAGRQPFIGEVRASERDDYAHELQDWLGAPDP